MCYTTAGGSRHHITCAPQLEPVSGCELEREREGESEGCVVGAGMSGRSKPMSGGNIYTKLSPEYEPRCDTCFDAFVRLLDSV